MTVRFIESYVHNGKIGVLIELECRDDFTTRTDEFRDLCRDLAMQIAAFDPISISPEEFANVVPLNGGASYELKEDAFLLKEPFVKDASKSVEQVIEEVGAELGESIRVVRFIRYVAGEI